LGLLGYHERAPEMTELDQDIQRHLWQERRNREQAHQQWLYGTLNDCFNYQWRCVAVGGRAVTVRWKFSPRPGIRKRFRLRTIPAFVRHWCSGGYHTAIMPGQTSRARLVRRYGPFLKIIKPRYWSDCHGCEPMLFSRDPEWTLESWLEHRRNTLSDWTAEDEERERQAFAKRREMHP
jgi:hypothetical protein